MTSNSAGSQTSRRREGGESASPLEYQVWPLASAACWREPPLRLAIAAGLVAFLIAGSLHLALLAAAIAALATWRFFVPSRYLFDAHGIHRRAPGTRRLVPWRTLRSVDPREQGLVLYTTTPRYPLDALASIYVPYGGHREQVMAWTKRFAPLAFAQRNGEHNEPASSARPAGNPAMRP